MIAWTSAAMLIVSWGPMLPLSWQTMWGYMGLFGLTAAAGLATGITKDTLTGLPSRVLFLNRLTRVLLRAKRDPKYIFAVLVVELDRLELVKESLGYSAVDNLLVAVAGRLKGTVRSGSRASKRSGEMLARIGEKEFAILIGDLKDASEAVAIAKRIREKLAMPFNIVGQDLFLHLRIGIALGPKDYAQAEDLLRDASAAVHQGHSNGRSSHVVFGDELHRTACTRLQLEADLERALERRQFRIHYQPIVSLETQEIRGFEALLRWEHPQRGLISPAEFIPLAEETGSIIPIGRWVLQEACRQVRTWQEQFAASQSLSINVNLSTKEFSQSDLIKEVRRVLAMTGLNAASLTLEITESALIGDTASAEAVLRGLKALQIRCALDDFGTGYSTLGHLQRFPIDELKIDRAFVNKLTVYKASLEIVQKIAALGRALGLSVTAEGVERSEQVRELRLAGCQYGQGYFFSKPLDVAGATMLLERNSQRGDDALVPWRSGLELQLDGAAAT